MADFSHIFFKPGEHDCLYFFHHLYETYRNKLSIQKLTFVEKAKETLLYCDCCFNERIVRYTKFMHYLEEFFDSVKNWSKEFFNNVKKNLIQYFEKVDELGVAISYGW